MDGWRVSKVLMLRFALRLVPALGLRVWSGDSGDSLMRLAIQAIAVRMGHN